MTNDEGDRHVLAAAVRAEGTLVVTWNRPDFPPSACEPYGIEVQDPDEFLCDLWDSDPWRMREVVKEQAGRLRNPPQTVDELLETLSRGVPAFVRRVREGIPG